MKILQSIDIFPVLLTLAAFRVGQLCQQKWKKPVFNPTLIAAILVIAFLLITGFETQVYNAGMGKLSWLMTPATISLAIPMYEQFQVLKKSLKAIAAGVADGTISWWWLGPVRCFGLRMRCCCRCFPKASPLPSAYRLASCSAAWAA